jgi:hypothetical protein
MRRPVIVAATILLAFSTFVAVVGVWTGATVTNRDAFVDSAVASFGLDGSSEALGVVMADKVVDAYPALTVLESGFAALFGSIIISEPFQPLLVEVSNQVHEVAIAGSNTAVVVDLSGYEDAVVRSLGVLAPDLATRIPSEVFGSFELFAPGELADASGGLSDAVAVGWLAVALSVMLVMTLVVVPRNGVVALIAIGGALVIGALATAVTIPIVSETLRVAVTDDAYRVLGRNLYASLVLPLSQRAWMITGIGAMMVLLGIVGWAVASMRDRSAFAG